MSVMIPNNLEKDLHITASLCDSKSQLSPIAVFALFQDIAGEHSNQLGIGALELSEKENSLWVIMRMKIRYHSFPLLNSGITIKTWPSLPQGMRSNRFYSITCNNEIVVAAAAEWAIINAETRKFRPFDKTPFPIDLDFLPEKAIDENYRRFRKDDFTESDFVYSLTVRSTMTDRAHHTNNVWYCNFLLDSFSVEELEAVTISEIEISYLRETHEGEQLKVFRKKTEDGWSFAIKKENGANAIMAFIAN